MLTLPGYQRNALRNELFTSRRGALSALDCRATEIVYVTISVPTGDSWGIDVSRFARRCCLQHLRGTAETECPGHPAVTGLLVVFCASFVARIGLDFRANLLLIIHMCALLTSICAIVLAVTPFQGPAKDRFLLTPEEEAKDFTFEGIKMGSSLKDFKKTYPSAAIDYRKSGKGIIDYVRHSKNADRIEYLFFDEQLILICITYEQQHVAKAGGVGAMLSTLETKYGKSTKARSISGLDFKLGCYTWNFSQVDRWIEMGVGATGVTVAAVDTNKLGTMQLRVKDFGWSPPKKK